MSLGVVVYMECIRPDVFQGASEAAVTSHIKVATVNVSISKALGRPPNCSGTRSISAELCVRIGYAGNQCCSAPANSLADSGFLSQVARSSPINFLYHITFLRAATPESIQTRERS